MRLGALDFHRETKTLALLRGRRHAECLAGVSGKSPLFRVSQFAVTISSTCDRC